MTDLPAPLQYLKDIMDTHYCPVCLKAFHGKEAFADHMILSQIRFVRAGIIGTCGELLQRSDEWLWKESEKPASEQSLAWNLSRSPAACELILPLAKSIFWTLPGHGHQYVSCGTPLARRCENTDFHPDHKTVWRYGQHSCMRKACPICRQDWGAAEAERALIKFAMYGSYTGRIEGLIKESRSEAKGSAAREFHRILCGKLEHQVQISWRGAPTHLMLSPPQNVEWWKEADFKALRDDATRKAQEMGMWAGSLVFHPYRLHCRLCDSVIDDYQKTCPKCGHRMLAWLPGPHFHLVGFGFIGSGADLFARSGWVAVNLGFRDSVFWTYQYLLSHAGVFITHSRLHTVTWFGKMSYRLMGKVPQVGAFRESCPYCGSYMILVPEKELADRPEPREPPDQYGCHLT